MTMRLISPRRTAPYHTLDSSSRSTSPSTVAPGTTHALECMVGPFFKRAAMPACPVGSESGSMCISMLDVRCSMFYLQLIGIAPLRGQPLYCFRPVPSWRGEDNHKYQMRESDFLISARGRL